MNKPGRPPVRANLQREYGLSLKQAKLARRIAAQLLACQSDAARRLILGVGEQRGCEEKST